MQQALQICCRSVATAQDYAQPASLDRGVTGDGRRHRGSSGAGPAAEDWHLPDGYYTSAGYCVPTNRPSTNEAIQKSGSTCPLGWYTSGSYCVRTP